MATGAGRAALVCALVLAVPWALAQDADAAGGRDPETISTAPALYLPLDEQQVLAIPEKGAELKITGTPRFVAGKEGQALAIDSEGVSATQVRITAPNLLNPEKGTIAFWFRPLTGIEPGRRYYLFTLLSSGKPDEQLHGFIDADGRFCLQSQNAGRWVTSQFAFEWLTLPGWSSDRWYHLAMTWGPDLGTTFYLDGKHLHHHPTSPGFTPSTAAVLDTVLLGSDRVGKRHANALLDEFLVFGAPLFPAEIPLCAPSLGAARRRLGEALEKLK